jgi:HD superfamily phosphohydrolase
MLMRGESMQQLTDEKVFKDPIHSFVRVTDMLIWQLIETPEFQRLRRVKQLGGTHIVYPTAEHSRFSHSLGVYFIARRMIDVLNKQGIKFTETERMLILCAALLHDLGHGPFSHSFESVLGIDHEDFTRRILLENTQINKLLERYAPGFSQKVSDVIEKTYPNQLIVWIICFGTRTLLERPMEK